MYVVFNVNVIFQSVEMSECETSSVTNWVDILVNRNFPKWNPVSLAEIPECLSDHYFWICKFRNKNYLKQILEKWYLFLNSWIHK